MNKTILACFLLIASYLSMYAQTGQQYKWHTYSPNVRYNFKEQNPNFVEPTKVLNDCPQVVGEISDRWFVFRWGPNRNPTITDNAIRSMLDRMNTDFAYFRDVMGWPADKRAKNGYRSAVYLYGSGLCTDNAPNTEGGGWQSSIFYNGQSWPMVLASYIPIRSFDPQYNDEYQKGAMVHEGIHAVLADMPGVKQSAWFQEGGNVWLQQTADARRSGNYSSMGNLNATDFMAPFMPIECYSGWLVDGSFGGPSAEGVNKYNSSNQQLCTWRKTLGGHQYSSMFPTALAQILGDGSIPWIWVNCPGRVLEGLAGGIGDAQMRRVITEYRSKMALMDLGEWTTASINLLNANFGQNIGVEWEPSYAQPPLWKVTPYASTTRSGNILTPDPITLPGWSGSNQIPLTVTGNTVTVDFQPIGANMTCQLVYRTTTGMPVYSQYVSSGNCTINLTSPPANNVVIAVITNTDYKYTGEATRTAKYDYRLGLVQGVTGAASINTKWYESAKLRNLNTVTFTGTVVGNGGISPEVSGYLVGDTAVITAFPKTGFSFTGWSGDVTSTANPLKIVMNSNKKVTATFTSGTNVAPTVSISSPANNATFTAPASITINATAADSDGTVSSVAFYNGTTLLGTDATSPYSFSWTNVAAGTYSLTARATDNAGAVTTSTAVSLVVNPTANVAPTVSISSPANNATFTTPASITINATAADSDGTVSSVAFYNGTILLGSDATSPYSFSWANVAAGTYSLTARATDNSGAITTSTSVSVVVSGPCTPTAITPYVQLNGGTWSQTSTASLNVGGTVKIGPQPVSGGSWAWSGPNGYTAATREITLANIQTNQAGSYIASYTNTAGCVSTQTFTITAVAANVAPTVSISSPANNASFTAPASITINATAADSDGTISSVAFYNGTTLLGTDVTSPYSFSWTNVSAGTYSLTTKATDNSGAVTTSAVVSVVVNPVTNVAPTVSISSPANNATFTAPASITINATAADSDGTVSNVDFYNGTTLLGKDTTSPYSFSWTNVAAGTYSLTARVTDNSGAVTTSTTVTVVVNPVANVAPTVSISSPANNASFTAPASITINATAADSDGTVSSVAFYDGTTLLGTDATSPYSFDWTNVAAGTYSLTARATDNSGAVTISAVVSVIVNNTSTADIIGVDCGNSNTTISFELNTSKRANATSYNWWYTGSSQAISFSATTPYIATMQTGANFSSGQVCVGVNYSVSPWYVSYCKSIEKCTPTKIGDPDINEILNTSVTYPNPSTNEFNFVTKMNVSKIEVINEFGQTVYSKENIEEGNDVLFGTNFSAGIYMINIIYQDGRHEIQKIIKNK